MTKLEIEAIRERAEKASKGDWYYIDFGFNDFTISSEYTEREVARTFSEDDADFIAHAREDIPKLLAEIERMRAGIMYAMQETYCDDTRDFLRRLLIGEEKTEIPYRMGHRYGGDDE